MWWRILKGLIYRNRASFVLALLSSLLGSALIASLVSVSLGVSDKISRELKQYGANILVKPSASRLLSEKDVAAIKTAIFWRYNITGVAPFLYETADVAGQGGDARAVVAGVWFKKDFGLEEGFTGGVTAVSPYLRIEGRWPPDESVPGAAVGHDLAERLGLEVGYPMLVRARGRIATLTVTGIMEGGGYEDNQVFVPLDFWQAHLSEPDKVSQALVSAVTVPLNDFGRRDPDKMTKREFDKWYCTAYVTSVARQVQETVKGASARPIWKVAEAEGQILGQLSGLIWGLAGMSLVAAALAVSTTLTSNALRRRSEVGLLKAIGGEPRQVVRIFLTEAAAIGVLAGIGGAVLGSWLAGYIGHEVFGSPFEFGNWLLALAVGSSLAITVLGSLVPLREALRVPAGEVMRG